MRGAGNAGLLPTLHLPCPGRWARGRMMTTLAQPRAGCAGRPQCRWAPRRPPPLGAQPRTRRTALAGPLLRASASRGGPVARLACTDRSGAHRLRVGLPLLALGSLMPHPMHTTLCKWTHCIIRGGRARCHSARLRSLTLPMPSPTELVPQPPVLSRGMEQPSLQSTLRSIRDLEAGSLPHECQKLAPPGNQ